MAGTSVSFPDPEEVEFASKNPFVGGVGVELSEEARTATRARRRIRGAKPCAPVLALAGEQRRALAVPMVYESMDAYRRSVQCDGRWPTRSHIIIMSVYIDQAFGQTQTPRKKYRTNDTISANITQEN